MKDFFRTIVIFILFFTSFLGFSQVKMVNINDKEYKEIKNLYSKANNLVSINEYSNSHTIFQSALNIYHKNYGDKKSNLRTKIINGYEESLTNLVNIYITDNELEKALPLLLKILNLVKIQFGENHFEYSAKLDKTAYLYNSFGNYKKAIQLYEELLVIFKRKGKNTNEIATTYNNLAYSYLDEKKYDKSIKNFENGLHINKLLFGEVSSEYLSNLIALADTFVKANKLKDAIIIYDKTLSIINNWVGSENKEYLENLLKLANTNQLLGNIEKAIELYHKSLIIIEEISGGKNLEYIGVLNKIVFNYISIGNYQKGKFFGELAVKVGKEQIDKNSMLYATSLSNLGFIYRYFNEYDLALNLLENSLKISKQNLESDNLLYIETLEILSDLHVTLKNIDYAIKLKQEILEILKKLPKKNNLKIISLLNSINQINIEYGNFSEILTQLEQAFNLVEKNIENYPMEYTYAANNFGAFYQLTGNFKKAEYFYVKSLKLCVKFKGKNSLEYATATNNLAGLYLEDDNYSKALPLIKESLKIRKEKYGENHPENATTLSTLALVYRNFGEREKALPLLLKANQILKNSYDENHILFGESLMNIGGFYLEDNNYSKAIPYLEEAKNIIAIQLGKNHPDYGVITLILAITYQSNNQFKNALNNFIENMNQVQNEIDTNFNFQTEKEKKIFLKNKVGQGQKLLSNFNYLTVSKYNEAINFSINSILTNKGILLRSTKNTLSELQALNLPEVNEKIKNFRIKKTFLNNQLQLPVDKRVKNLSKYKDTLHQVESDIIRQHNYFLGKEKKLNKNWNENSLNDNELAIEFTYFKVYNKKWTDSTMYAAYLYKKDWKTPKVVNLFEEKQLKKYFSTSSNPNNLYKSRGTITKSNSAQLSLADSIYKLVWKPLEKYIDSTKKIYFSPDGLLHKIPFAALPNENNQLIGELYNIQQMGNTADARVDKKQPNLNDILLIGGVKYDYEIGSTKQKKDFTYSILESKELLGNEKNRNLSRNGFGYLEGTELEINKIDSLLGSSKQLSGYEATETAFKKLSGNSPSVLHIATHGFFFKKPKEKPKNAELSGEQNSYKLHENPLLRSGLLFANANYAWQNGNNPYEEDDGILTALEISNLDLKTTDIVILSACETGLGDIEGSEGVYGLQRAFKMAGVKTIIMSLWPVPDAETAEFMNLFYTKWKAYNNSKKAFKETQQLMMNKYRDEPQKWAAFVYFE